MQERMYGLDFLRALLIIEGVFYHTALIISPIEWSYSSLNYNSYSIGLFFQFFHLFRMETFFFLAGFFSYLLIDKKGVSYFIENRYKRILIPFIILLIVICAPQFYFILTEIKTFESFIISHYVSHLWFLGLLAFYSVIHLIVLNKNIKTLYLIIFSIFSIIGSKIFLFIGNNAYFIIDDILLFISLSLEYCSYYIIGIYTFKNKEKVLNLINKNIKKLFIISTFITCLILLKTYLVWMEIWSSYPISFRYITQGLLIPVLKFINAISITFILFNLFIGFNLSNLITKTIVNSALVIYVLHHPLVIFSGYTLDHYNMNIYLFFICVSALSLGLPLILFLCFQKNRVFKRIFGLK